MKPKPTRDWVISELERLEIRVVSGGRANRQGEEDMTGAATSASASSTITGIHPGMMPTGLSVMTNPLMNSQMGAQQLNMMHNAWNNQDPQNNLKQARRSSSLGLALLSNEFGKNNAFSTTEHPVRTSASIGLIPKPAFRELVGGGAAAAYNAYRDDFYRRQPNEPGSESDGKTNGNNGNSKKTMRFKNIEDSNVTPTNPNE